MNSLWNDQEAAQFPGELGLRVYTSRLLGRDKSLVLHGGGNTSVKIKEQNIFGEEETILYIKGSGWDLATIEEKGFTPVRMAPVLRLAELESLSDSRMENELLANRTRASAPTPSVETILHALLPYQYVDHTHADAVISVTNSPQGLERIQKIYGDSVVVIPYVMPGFILARICAQLFPKHATPNTIGMVLMQHGIFSFGSSAREAYERMISLVHRAESYLRENKSWASRGQSTVAASSAPTPAKRQEFAQLRREISRVSGVPMILHASATPEHVAFARRPDLAELTQQGPATPDHVIRTKRLPLIGRDLQAYVQEYRKYFEAHAAQSGQSLTMVDPAPRVLLDPELGLCTVGRTAKDAAIAREIYEHTIDIILRAAALGGWHALPAKDLFEVEYWELEQAKLKKQGTAPMFAGEVALVTGAASGIGKACVDAFLGAGAAVVGLDKNAAIESLHRRPEFLGLTCDLTDESSIANAIERAVLQYGGLDMLVLNAGIFPPGRPIEKLDTKLWRTVMSINLDANLVLLRECHPLLKVAPKGGRVVIVGSKNVPAPGPGAAAYSASKAAINQLARVAALEWGGDNIRINSIHPNQVFDTGLWTQEVLESRARHYGLSVEAYKTNNLLKVEIKSTDVAQMAAAMCAPLFAKTTAAQVPIDGGNDRVV
jgi:rhamnose utilization protein RhaD (predicted bifunctional aldolase and dehydrogenase)/NAD(P)-dependent dehydrogenase (short-subunit alcohol dehydrogenase family)